MEWISYNFLSGGKDNGKDVGKTLLYLLNSDYNLFLTAISLLLLIIYIALLGQDTFTFTLSFIYARGEPVLMHDYNTGHSASLYKTLPD